MTAFSLFLLEAQRDFFSDLQSEKLIGLLEVLGWPKSSFGFFHKMLQKTQTNFLANPIKFRKGGGPQDWVPLDLVHTKPPAINVFLLILASVLGF